MSYIDLFRDQMGDDLQAQPGHLDARGTFIPSGAMLTVPCHLRGRDRLVHDAAGNQVVSSFQAIVLADEATQKIHGFTADRHRYTLPGHAIPATGLRAVGVRVISDETGPIYEEVMFP